MKRHIRLSPDVAFSLDAVTQTFAVLGKRGSGKTNTASVLTEQLIKAGLPVVYVDPIGVTWGLRHARDGKHPGLPVIILGGEHADVPLEETGGAVIADFVIDHRQPVVVDLGLFSKGAQRRFMVDFSERLYHKNRDALHIMLDECDTFVPQRIDHGGERLVGAINDLVRKGRARGLGVTLISQRPALVNKDVLTQVEVLVAHRMTGPQDRDAIERWIEQNADREGDEVLASLQLLSDGDAWVWSPSWLKMLKRTHINLRETFDSSATPKAGARVVAPKKAAEIDLGSLRDQLAATIEKAKSDDPRELRKRITELEKRKPVTVASEPREVEVKVEVPVLTKRNEKNLERLVTAAEKMQETLSKRFIGADEFSKAARELVETVRAATSRIDRSATRIGKSATVVKEIAKKARTTMNGAHKPIASGPTAKMPIGYKRILLALARHGECSKGKLAILARYAIDGGGFNNNLSDMRKNLGHITGEGDGPYAITEDGLKALGSFDPLPDDADALFEEWLKNKEIGKAHREIMRVLRKRGIAMVKEDIAAECDPPYEADGGGFNNAISRLRTLGVVSGKKEIDLAEQLKMEVA